MPARKRLPQSDRHSVQVCFPLARSPAVLRVSAQENPISLSKNGPTILSYASPFRQDFSDVSLQAVSGTRWCELFGDLWFAGGRDLIAFADESTIDYLFLLQLVDHIRTRRR